MEKFKGTVNWGPRRGVDEKALYIWLWRNGKRDRLTFRVESQMGRYYFVDDNIKSWIVDAIPVFTLKETLLRFNQSDLEFIVAAGNHLREVPL